MSSNLILWPEACDDQQGLIPEPAFVKLMAGVAALQKDKKESSTPTNQ
jgi:hypothetical protein